MTMKGLWGAQAGLAGGVALLAVAGCDVDVIDYPDGGSGGASASGGGSPVGSGGTIVGSGGAGTGGYTGIATGGMFSNTGAGGFGGAEADFPWPDLPSARGTVVDIEPWDPSTSGCCTRVPGEGIQSEYCPVGVVERQTKEAVKLPEETAQPLTFNLKGSPIVVVIGTFAAGTQVGVMATDVPPPENIVDFSPVVWVGTETGELPPGAMVSLTVHNYVGVADQGIDGSPSVFYSEDGVEFQKLDEPEIFDELGATGLLEKPGFLVAGLGDVVQCQDPDE